MADNVVANAGSGGATFATDDIGGVHYPITKLAFGALDSATLVVATAGLPVAPETSSTWAVTQSGTWNITNAGTFAVQVDGDALTALQLIDDAVYTDGTGTPSKGFGVMGTDGTNPQLVSVNTSGHVNIADGGNAITVDNGGTFAVQAAQSGTWNITNISGTVSLPTGAATAAKQPALGTAGSASTDVITVQGIASMTALVVDGSGVTQPVSGTVTANLAAGSNLIGNVGIGTRTSGGVSVYYDNDLDETAVAAKAGAGQIYFIHAINLGTAPRYLQIFNVAQGSVTVGTTAPTMQFVIPSQGDANGAGFTLSIPMGIAFDTAITVAATTNSQGNGAPGANEVHVNIGYA